MPMIASDRLQRDRFDAVLFDMDGVVTDTAAAHAAAWKLLFDAYLESYAAREDVEFQPFDANAEYRAYVDGKPRYDGIQSFLHSRGIELPFGDPGDSPDQETVCGLGNRKDGYFNEWLSNNKARVFPGTHEFIAALKAAGVRVAIFSASRNMNPVLLNAGVETLFDAKVDGQKMSRLGLPGKPDPAMLELAAAELGLKPDRCVIVEDAIAGVQAGKRGAFAFLIGIDRSGYSEALREHGADLVVNDLSECQIDDAGNLQLKRVGHLAPIWAQKDALEPLLRERRIAILLDYDGTLTPIVADYRKALLAESMRNTLRELSQHNTVAVISGRGLADVRQLVGLDTVFYSGSHGFELSGPNAWQYVQDDAASYIPDLDRAEQQLGAALAAIPGHAVERKRFSIAVHYRQVDTAQVVDVERAVNNVLDEVPRLHKGLGKKVFELKPALQWDKGRAVELLLQMLDMTGNDSLAIYIGDDLTDEAAYRVLRKAEYQHRDKRRRSHHLRGQYPRGLRRRATISELAGNYGRGYVGMSEWSLIYEGYDPAAEKLRETLCTLGNGYFATRGASPDSSADANHYPGTYFAGVYNRLTSEIAGESIENEDLVNWPNWLVLRIRPEGEDWLSIDATELLGYRQELSLRDGILRREIRFRHGDGRATRYIEKRLVGMSDRRVAALSVDIEPLNWTGGLTICSAIDGAVRNNGVARYSKLANHHTRCILTEELAEDTIRLISRTTQSHIEVAEAARTRVYRDGSHVVPVIRTLERDGWIGQELDVEVHEGSNLRVEKIVAVCTSRDRGISEPGYDVARTIATSSRFEQILRPHALSWQALWDEFDFALDTPTNSATTLALRVHIFHILQTISPHTLATDAGVPARGWHGEAYRGHVFWDEIFILPFLNLRMPLVTRAMLPLSISAAARSAPGGKRCRFQGCNVSLAKWQRRP